MTEYLLELPDRLGYPPEERIKYRQRIIDLLTGTLTTRMKKEVLAREERGLEGRIMPPRPSWFTMDDEDDS